LSKRKKGRDNEAPLNRNKRRREEKATERKEKKCNQIICILSERKRNEKEKRLMYQSQM
jgi:hypothetical protein